MEEGLRVLAVDDDKMFLVILEKMLRSCKYQVTICNQGKDAVSILQDDSNRFDIILCDVHMPDVDGFKLLEVIGSKTDIPVVLMSGDDSSEAVKKGVISGACDFLIKPVTIEQVGVLWQHVLRRRQNGLKGKMLGQNGAFSRDNTSRVSGPSTENVMRRNDMEKRQEDEEEEGEASPEYGTKAKKPRIIWTTELHEKFYIAVKQLGIDKAVPKKILECMQQMGETELTRENVASHLQKFRLYVRKMNMDSLEQCGNSSSFAALNGFEQASSSGHHQFGSAQYQYGNGIAMPLHEQRKLLNPMMLLHASQVHHGVSPNLGFGSSQEIPLLGQPVLNFPNGGNNSLFEPVNNYGRVDIVPHAMELGSMIDHHQQQQQQNNYSMDDQGMVMTQQSFVPNGNLYAQLIKHRAGVVLPEQSSDHEAHLYSYDHKDAPYFDQTL